MTASSSKASAATSSDADMLDGLVCEIVNRLDAGQEIDLAELAGGNADILGQLQQLLPTLEAMIDLGHSVAPAAIGNVQSNDPGSSHTLGDFRIIREIGRGGMGVVYEAEQLSLQRRVALKVLPFATVLDQRNLERFKNEARAAAALRHPHIVNVYSVGCERSVHFYAMEYIDGHSLAEVIEELRKGRGVGVQGSGGREGTQLTDSAIGNPKSEIDTVAALSTLAEFDSREYYRSIARLVEQAAGALHYAHQVGIVHRDIKPSNLLLDGSGSVWVTDFGLATTQGNSNLTMTGDFLGTLRYMSPEQAQSRRGVVDHRTDIYSLGITLYELLALRPAFDGADRQSLLQQLADQQPVLLRTIDNKIPEDLETIVVKATSKEPQDRYATAEEFADDLRRFLDHKPVLARRPTRRHRIVSWIKRNPKAASLITIVTSLLTLLATGGPLVALQQARLAAQVQDQLYDRDMKIAQEALARGEFDRVDRILAQHSRDRRHFEWNYLYANSRRGLTVPTFDHWVKVHDAELSPDGRHVAVGVWDGTVHVYDVRTQRTVWSSEESSEEGHESIIVDVSYSADGRLIATSSADRKAIVWNAATGQPIERLGPFASGVSDVVFSPDGAHMALAAYTKDVGHQYSTSAPAPIHLFAITVEGAREDLQLQIQPQRELAGASGRVQLAFSCDGALLAAGSDDGTVRMWELPLGKAIEPLPASGPSVFSVAFSPTDPDVLACGMGTFKQGWLGGDVRLWNVRERQLVRTLSGHTAGVRRVSFSRDGKRLATASADRTAKVWDLGTYSCIDTLQGHAGTVCGVSFSPDGNTVATASFDNTVRLWKVASAVRPPSIAAHFRGVNDLAFSPDDQTLATGGEEGTVRIWDVTSGAPLDEFSIDVRQVNAVAFSPDGRTLLAGGGYYPQINGPPRLDLWNVATKEHIASFEIGMNPNGKHTICWSAVFSPDGKRIAAAIPPYVVFYDVAEQREQFRVRHKAVRRIRWSPDGTFVASAAGSEASVKVWDPHTCNCLHTIVPAAPKDTPTPLLAVAISPDSKTLACQGENFDITLCDAASGKQTGALEGHTDLIFYLDWHPDGQRLVSASTDNTCRVWNVDTEAELLTFREAPSWMLSARFSHDGSLLVTGEANSLWGRLAPIRFYDAAHGLNGNRPLGSNNR